MRLQEVVDRLGLEVLTGRESLGAVVSGGYVGDLLSDVIANGQPGNIWITFQAHENVIAVATLREFSAVVLINGRKLEASTLMRAREEKIPVLGSDRTAFEIVGELFAMGVQAGRNTQDVQG
jgi:predicted transcriptional regulator